MNPAKIKKLAKQGNSQAIAVLLNHSLQRQGVTAKVGRENNSLQVMLESGQVPPTKLAKLIFQWLINLGVESIERVQIYGRQIGEEIPDWSQDIDLANLPKSTPSEADSSASAANNELQDLSSSVTAQAKINTHKASTPITPHVTENHQQTPQAHFASTPQPSLKLASQTKRFLNFILDILFYLFLCFIFAFLIGILWYSFNPDALETNEAWPENDFIDNLIAYVLLFIYYAVPEAIWSKSLAKFITKTKVVTNRNEKPNLKHIIWRTLARFIPLDALTFLTSDYPRGWHDKVSGTKVVND